MNDSVKNNGKTWCSIQEAAEILGVSYQTVRRRILSGDLEAKKEGRWYFVKYSDVEKLAEHMKNTQKPDKTQLEIAMELKLANEKIQMLQEQINSFKERIKDLEADKGFLLEQLREKDRQIAEKDKIISELMPRALPKPKTTIRGKIRRLFGRSRNNT